MTVTLRYHEDCEPGLEAWVESLPGNDPERREFARLYLTALEQELAAAHGRVAGAITVAGLRPPVFWWRYHSGWWMRYCVETVRPWLRAPAVRIIVLEVADRGPPTPGSGGRADG